MTLSPEKRRYWNIMLKPFKANALFYALYALGSPSHQAHFENQPHCAPKRGKNLAEIYANFSPRNTCSAHGKKMREIKERQRAIK